MIEFQNNQEKQNLLDQLLLKVNKTDNCWLWRGIILKGRRNWVYGRVSYKRKSYYAHKVFYQLLKGEITNNLVVSRTCNQNLCVNPEHLYLRDLKYQLTDEELLKECLDKIQKTDNCWIWIGDRDCYGYGRLNVERKSRRAHRIIYRLFKGPVPEDLVVRHTCDNPPCVNPDHLLLATLGDNNRDRVERGRTPKGSNAPGAKFNQQQVDQIRTLFASGGYSKVRLGEMFGANDTTIGRIVSLRTYKP